MTILSSILSWFLSEPPSGPPSVTIRVLRIPADSSNPHILLLHTIDITNDGNVDVFLCHVPDTRAFWGHDEDWRYRDVSRSELKTHNPGVDGIYYGFKSYALDHSPLNKAAASCIYGDAFIAKVTDAEHDQHSWATYEDVPGELLSLGLYKQILEHLARI